MSSDSKTLPLNFDETLIYLARINPQMYLKDPRAKPYESMKDKSDLWKRISTLLGVDANICMLRWKELLQRYRRDIQINKESINAGMIADTPLLEKMRFLDRHVSFRHKHDHMPNNGISKPNIAPSPKTGESYGGVNYEYLPEAMETQSLTSNSETTLKSSNFIPTSTNSALVRIKALLEGLDAADRSKAEKRILSYLCKCQIKALENESIDDINL